MPTFTTKIKMKLRAIQFNITELRLYLFNSDYRKALKESGGSIFTK